MSQCINCQSTAFDQLYNFHDIFQDQYTLCNCKHCDAYFLEPKPSADQLKRAYADDYYGEGEKKFNPTVEKVLNFFRARKAKAISNYLKEGDRYLDFGCGDGELLYQISKQGNYQLDGIEIEGKAAQRAAQRKEVELFVGELTEADYPDNYFQLVSMIHVFEHLPNPSEVVNILSQIIREDGYLIIEQPNIESWQAKVFKGKWLHLDPPRHLNFFGPDALTRLLGQYGFKEVERSFFSPQFSPFGTQQSLLNLLFKKRELLYEHLKGNKTYTKDQSRLSLGLQKLFHWLSFPLFIFTDLLASFFGRGGTMKMVYKREG